MNSEVIETGMTQEKTSADSKGKKKQNYERQKQNLNTSGKCNIGIKSKSLKAPNIHRTRMQ